jgi:catechol 2,3-dioxygenase-like lactoylglutathione lyase family enzyme
MPVGGPLSHIDLTISEPERSILFYAAFFDALGYRRWESTEPDFAEPSPRRAAWFVKYASGAFFGIEIRPARTESRDKSHDRYAPGLHHLAFHAESREHVDRIYGAMQKIGATILDPPADYSGQRGYGPGYYAVFVGDPDGLKLEVVHEPGTNP